ncbi:FAD-binding and (Fe-S)-binding domain-containing protein [Homoserinibacter sp. GY 40078]|uniref:FAD-binding and (Fe-S)-binding domain-containing protein n=1 Tax=Homoserinibacter sp. GY 40078 TaxID=2603275 RepID=UPI0011C975DF|nr:FAD-binding and (Fe-S)-binding domain-containing protein [Homoserinibacter sp. GY 40078]TXK18681.1 FAD-binding oxidoreductase [Homoserinibacter sp. GY 40078]
MSPATVATPLDPVLLDGVEVTGRTIERYAMAHDASHYSLIPEAIATPRDTDELRRIMAAATAAGRPIAFRSGGTSLSGQGVSDGILVDTRKHFRGIEVLDAGARVRVQPGATVRQVNARLSRHGRKLGPDPASEIACTIGGVIADNSSGMACGITQNSYRTLESMIVVLPDGTVLDTGASDADERLAASAPALHAGLTALRRRLLDSPEAVARVRQQFSMKNTMGYGVNSLLDFDRPIDILSHLIVGSEGTLAFVAEATFATVEVMPSISTGLLVFPDLDRATEAIPALVEAGFATVELMDARSLAVAQGLADVPEAIAGLSVAAHTALLVELHATDPDALAAREAEVAVLLASFDLAGAPRMTRDAAERAALWRVRKGLYPAIAGARPSGSTALLEDIVVPVDRLRETCEHLVALFDEHGYEDSVIFGHAKDGNLHFMLTERFTEADGVERYRAFTDALVELVLGVGGSLKAEHGTGRVMAPFVHRQYGDELYAIMCEIKALFDPQGILNPGVIISDDPDSYLQHLKRLPRVESEVDRCVECGYCEPSCPSRDLTLTPRQRIGLRRDIAIAEADGDDRLAAALRADYDYDGVQTCAVDGMCAVACPVDINTGDLVRRLRAENRAAVPAAVWGAAARAWGATTRAGGIALTIADVLPAPLVTGVTDAARAVLGADTVPRYDSGLPRGGQPRPRATGPVPAAQAVFFAACIGTMFGPEPGGDGDERPLGSADAFLRLAARAGVEVVIPDGIGSLCCGTPWKSKGFTGGYQSMSERVLPALWEASRGGELPIVCDAASCTEGLETMATIAAAAGSEYAGLRFIDSTEFVRDELLGHLTVTRAVESVAVHPTCSTTALGTTDALVGIARALSPDVVVPDAWGCCAFAGDRGLLHPELTASATAPEAAELAERDYAAYVSANRTCELGMTRASGKPFEHVLTLLERATRVRE